MTCSLRAPGSRRSIVRLLSSLAALPLAFVLGDRVLSSQAPPAPLPPVHAGLSRGPDGQMVLRLADGSTFTAKERPAPWTLAQLRGAPRGTDTGIALDFGKPGFNGTLAFGLIPYHDTRYPLPVYRTTVPIKDGKAEIDIRARLSGTYDMVGWAKSGRGVLGYRVLTAEGAMLHDGRVAFRGTGPFEVDVTMLEGPFVANVTDRGVVIWFELDRPAPCSVSVTSVRRGARGGAGAAPTRTAPCSDGRAHQEITIDRLEPDTEYRYTVRYGPANHEPRPAPARASQEPRPAPAQANRGVLPAGDAGGEETYGFRTAPKPGSRRPFVFGYASDSRGGVGGGERNFLGPNAHIMRRLMAVAAARGAAFLQFTGDLVSGGAASPEDLLAQLANWKRTIEPQAHWLPVYTGIGNHEGIVRDFFDAAGKQIRLPRFPFATESTEATFARALVNPANGPASEDGAAYDPDPATVDFPTYRENVFSYVHDNVAVVVLNSDYWFTPGLQQNPQAGGNLHGYLMDAQEAWLAKQLGAFERNAAIDHVFLTIHTPIFPNGGHVGDDMWYRGKNEPRPWVAGKPVAKGIIERRDQILGLIDSHPKVLAALTGDEHNYNRTRIGPGMTIYPDGWTLPKITLRRTFFQVNNGAAGAPYYAQEQTPWSGRVSGFSTQNAICLFHVSGRHVRLEVVNPETLEVIDRAVLR